MASRHPAQFFDAPRSQAEAAARHLAEGWSAGEHLLVMARPAHWARIATLLEQRGCHVRDIIGQGRLTFLDAEAVLRRVTRRGGFASPQAQQALRKVLLAEDEGRPLRVYSEVGELLAEEGDFDAAAQFEDLLIAIEAAHPLRLFCGYLAPSFADPRYADALARICSKHTRVRTQPADSLAAWLVASAQSVENR